MSSSVTPFATTAATTAAAFLDQLLTAAPPPERNHASVIADAFAATALDHDALAEALLARFEAYRARCPRLDTDEARPLAWAFHAACDDTFAATPAVLPRLALASARLTRARFGSAEAATQLVGALTHAPQDEPLFDYLAEIVRDPSDTIYLDESIHGLPETPEHQPLVSRLWDLNSELRPTLPSFDQPILRSHAEVPDFFATLHALRVSGKLAEATFRYRAAFAGYPGLVDAKNAVETDPIPLPAGYVFPH